MSERLTYNFQEHSSLSESQQIQSIANHIVEISIGKIHRFPSEDPSQYSESDYETDNNRIFRLLSSLFKGLKKEERLLFNNALASIFENSTVDNRVKTTLISLHTLVKFDSDTELAVDSYIFSVLSTVYDKKDLRRYKRLLQNLSPYEEVDDLITKIKDEERLTFDFRLMVGIYLDQKLLSYLSTLMLLRLPKSEDPEKHPLTKEDYMVTKSELREQGITTRKLYPNFVVDYVRNDTNHKYSFYEFGTPCDHQYTILDIDLTHLSEYSTRYAYVTWYLSHSLEFIVVANSFIAEVLDQQRKLDTYQANQWEGIKPGLYMYPDGDTRITATKIYIPFTEKMVITAELLEEALRVFPEFVNYDLTECSIQILISKDAQLHYRPFNPEDQVRNSLERSESKSRYFLEMSNSINPAAIVSILRTANPNELPWDDIDTMITKTLAGESPKKK